MAHKGVKFYTTNSKKPWTLTSNTGQLRGGDGLAPGMIGVTELLWRHPGMTVGRLNDMLDGRSKAAERELELEQKR